MTYAVQLLAITGFLISAYALYVESKLKSGDYSPFCDFGKHASCSKSFTGDYGHLLYLPNAFYGILFYAVAYYLTHIGSINFVLMLSLPGLVATAVLAYLSYFKERNFCIVCSAIYMVNILLFLLSFMHEFMAPM